MKADTCSLFVDSLITLSAFVMLLKMMLTITLCSLSMLRRVSVI